MQSHVIVRGIVLENDTLGISGKVPSVPFITICQREGGEIIQRVDVGAHNCVESIAFYVGRI